jgi:hypothetical protein
VIQSKIFEPNFNLSVLHVWFKTFRWNHPVYSTCLFFMSGSKLLDWITLYVQLVCSTDKLNIQEDSFWKFSTREVEHTRWFHPSFEPDMKNRQVEYTGWFHLKVLNQTWRTDRLNIKGEPCMFKLSILHVWFKTFGWNHPVCSNCLFFMSGSKLLDGNTLYVQLVYFISGWKLFWTRQEVLTNWT